MKTAKLTAEKGRLLPAYPLFVKDPYFSIWSPCDELNGGETIFWTGKTRRLQGVVHCDGVTYSFMGLLNKTTPIKQTRVTLTAFSTDYEFECDKFNLSVSFISPLPPTNLTLLSCPVCYMTYAITPKTKIGKAVVCLALHEESCYDRQTFPVSGGVHKLPQGETAFFGLKKQLVMSNSGDDAAAEWGYWYMTGEEAMVISKGGYDKFLVTGKPSFEFDVNQNKYLTAYNTHENFDGVVEGKFTLAFDDIVSINYYGDFRKGYYFNEGKTVIDAIADAWENFDAVKAELEAFDNDLKARAEKYGEDYLLVLYAGLRQAVGAHKLVKDKNGEVLWLSKECHSNGCIATVDVSYPSMPLFLLYNPELVKGMMRPIFEFANMPVWEYDFAPHDAGTYPQCIGQIYGNKIREENCKQSADFKNIAFGNQADIAYTYPPVYTYPKGSDMFLFAKQMPVEECGNMLIMTAATLVADGDKTIAKKNFKLLTKWVKYLVKYGLKPGNQLCTDDFAGHLDKNINLSIKAIVGIRAFAYICDKLGKDSLAVQYKDIAYNYATKWKEMCVREGKQTPLVFDGDENTFALKYNMAFDVLMGTNLFDEKVREREVDYYISVSNEYGVPLDNRIVYTKSDWILWAATLTSDIEKRKKLIAPMAKFLRESKSRYPFPDSYFTDTGLTRGEMGRFGYHYGYKNRTVQGALFILLLADSGIMNIYGDKDEEEV